MGDTGHQLAQGRQFLPSYETGLHPLQLRIRHTQVLVELFDQV